VSSETKLRSRFLLIDGPPCVFFEGLVFADWEKSGISLAVLIIPNN
jgi:hypothetical protein